MARSAIKVFLGADDQVALDTRSRSEGRPVSELLLDAVRLYLTLPAPQERRHLGSADLLSRLRAYQERDPHFRAAIASFAKQEARLHDPLEDTVIHDAGQPRSATAGPVQTRLHDLLRA